MEKLRWVRILHKCPFRGQEVENSIVLLQKEIYTHCMHKPMINWSTTTFWTGWRSRQSHQKTVRTAVSVPQSLTLTVMWKPITFQFIGSNCKQLFIINPTEKLTNVLSWLTSECIAVLPHSDDFAHNKKSSASVCDYRVTNIVFH